MAINSTELKNSFLNIGWGALVLGGTFACGYDIYQRGAMRFAARLMKPGSTLALFIFTGMNLINDIFSSFNLLQDKPTTRDFLACSISFTTSFFLADLAVKGYRAPGYLFASFTVAILVCAFFSGKKALSEGLSGLKHALVG